MNLKEIFTPLPVLSEDEINNRLEPDCFRPVDEIPNEEFVTPDDLYDVRLSTLKNIQIIYDRKTSVR